MKSIVLLTLAVLSLSSFANLRQVPVRYYQCDDRFDPNSGLPLDNNGRMRVARSSRDTVMDVKFRKSDNRVIELGIYNLQGFGRSSVGVRFPDFQRASSFKSFIESNSLAEIAIPDRDCRMSDINVGERSYSIPAAQFVYRPLGRR